MLEIKSGILGAAILLQARYPDEDVFFLPMAISYEYPPDAPWFPLLLRGKKMRKKTQPFYKRFLGNVFYFGADLLAFLPYITARKTGRAYGAAYIDFDTPVAIRSLVDIEGNRAKDVKDVFFSHRASMQKVADFIAKRFFALYRLLPMHLVAAIGKNRDACAIADLEAAIPALLDTLRADGRNLTSLVDQTPADIVKQGIRQLERLKAVSQTGDIVSIKKRNILEYYAAPVNDGISATEEQERGWRHGI